MRSSVWKFFASVLLAGAAVLCIQFLTDSSGPFGFLGFIVLPGYLPAALVFPEGFHSDSPFGFMTLVVLFDGLIYGLLLWWIWRHMERSRSRSATN